MNASQLCRWQFSHKKKFVADFLFKQSAIFDWKRPFCVFVPLVGLRATYDVHLRLIENRVVDFLLVLIELFAIGATAEALRANVDWKSAFSVQRGQLDPKFLVEGVAPHQPFFSHKTRLNDRSCGVKIWPVFFVSSQCTPLTDGQTPFSWLDRPALNAAR